jgi:hypothetical protein
VLVLEMRPFVLSGIEVQAKVRALADLGMTPGPSNLSQRMVLDDCFAASRSLLLRAAPSTTRDRLLVHCARRLPMRSPRPRRPSLTHGL